MLLFFSRSICGFVIDYLWWRELGQVPTWVLHDGCIAIVPGLAGWLIVFAVLWIAHARGMKHAGTRLRGASLVRADRHAGLALIALIVALAAVDGWTVARYFGGTGGIPA